jgi:hypothetical protein
MARYPRYATTVIGAYSVPDWNEALDLASFLFRLTSAGGPSHGWRSATPTLWHIRSGNRGRLPHQESGTSQHGGHLASNFPH